MRVHHFVTKTLTSALLVIAGWALTPAALAQSLPGTGCPPSVAITGPATVPAAGGLSTWCYLPCASAPSLLLVGTTPLVPFVIPNCGALQTCTVCVPLSGAGLPIACNAAGCFSILVPPAPHGTQLCIQKICFGSCLFMSQAFVVTWC